MENAQQIFTPIELLKNQLKSFTDCALITDGINRRYFTQMKSSAGTLVVFPEKAYLIIDFRYIEKARKTVKGCDVILQKNLYEQINALIDEHNVERFPLKPII